MAGNTTIIEALGTAPAATAKMREAISLWTDMYENHPYWIHEPDEDDHTRVISIGLPALIASEKARMATLEFVSKITSETDADRAEFLDKSYQVGLVPEIRKQSEYAIAKGGLAITPYPVYQKDKEGKEKLHHFAFDFTQADRFIPISFDSQGRLIDAAFVMRKETEDYIYYRLERQSYANGVCTVSNRLFRRSASETVLENPDDIYDIVLGKEVSLEEVPEWSGLEAEKEISGVDRCLFAYLKMPHANNIESDSPLGVSSFSRAVGLIRNADVQYARLDWEYEAAQMHLDVDDEALKEELKEDGSHGERHLSQLQDRLCWRYDTNDPNTYNVYAPTMRDQSYINGLETILTRIEDACALSHGTISRLTEQARTATELKILKQRTYSENADIQQAIQKALEDVVYIMDVYYSLINGEKNERCDVSFEFDDSIIVDRETELQQRLTLQDRGLTSKVENRMWYFGETEDQAIEAIAKIEQENTRKAVNLLDGEI